MDRVNALRLTGIHKAFGSNAVLRGIDLDIPAGRVTALMGANGAGKSTLVKIVGGVHAADAGRIELRGAAFAPATPADAIRAGVVTVHQQINDGVIPDLDVATNLVLDRLAGGGAPHVFNPARARREAAEIAARMGLELDLRAPVRRLPLAERQLVAIARAMAHEPDLLILDEPTSSLSDAEARRLFALIDRLRDRGVAILYISHRMSDIRRVADRIVSMRDGTIAGLFEAPPLDYEGAVNAMLGHGMADVDLAPAAAGETVLAVEGMRLIPGAAPFSMTARRGEVVAITGLIGMGKTAFAETLYGLRRPVAGAIALEGRPYAPRDAADAISKGVFLSAKDRGNNAVIPDFSIARNITLPFLGRFSVGSVVNRAAERQAAREQIRSLGIVCQGAGDRIGTLSGGNQQKVVVARWLAQPSRLLILDEPFQGVDIAARRDIGDKLRQTAGQRATLVLCAELDEALEVADRILVMSEHTIVGEHVNRNVDLDRLLSEVAGRAGADRPREAEPAA
ncbi:MAG: ATP-binding cassette domain-containing protein [Alphaproteobacteria bacterium]|jgi:simple sugar transport system ATP-binding protein|nr:ATP-binding cassette domain-containing protein [Alphaproteobacteria bacterium]